MTKFKLYKDILSNRWNRFLYNVEANTIEEAVEKVRNGEVYWYNAENVYGTDDDLDNLRNGGPTREIYNDNDELMWNNAVNRGRNYYSGYKKYFREFITNYKRRTRIIYRWRYSTVYCSKGNGESWMETLYS